MKKKTNTKSLFALGIVAAVMMVAAIGVDYALKTQAETNGTACEYVPYVTDLMAGQNTDAGDVTVINDLDNLYITYQAHEGWELTETHFHIADTLEGIPQTKKGNPSPGQFDYKYEYDPAITEITYTLSLDEFGFEVACGDTLYIATHAVVQDDSCSETASVYGITRNTGEVYESDVLAGTAVKLFTTDNPPANGSAKPNGLAYDVENNRMYYTDYQPTTKLYFWDGAAESQVEAGLLDVTAGVDVEVAAADFYNGKYYYIDGPVATDDLYEVTFNADGTLLSNTKIADISNNAHKWTFNGDIAIKDGVIYGWGKCGSHNKYEFFTYDLNNPGPASVNETAFQDYSMQLAFGSDGELYGHESRGDGKFYVLDQANGDLTEVVPTTPYSGPLYTDCASGELCEGSETETGWGYGPGFPGKNWATYFTYEVQCCDEEPTVEGCTLTQGYWRTHSQYGPAPYDDNWVTVGEDTPFFSSGETWYSALWVSPRGDAYYILAQQYIASVLNVNNGASTTSAVDAAMAGALSWFNSHSPGVPSSTPDGQIAVGYSAILDAYNNGVAEGGPPHCGDQEPEPECVNPPSGMQTWLPFENNVTNIVNDQPGTLVGNASYTAGMVGQAFDFDGSTFVKVPDPTDNQAAFTFDAWVNFDTLAQDQFIAGDWGNGWLMFYRPALAEKGLNFYVRGASGLTTVVAAGANDISANQWHHITGVYSAAEGIKVYLDGALIGSGSYKGTVNPGTSEAKIGASGYSGHPKFLGMIDEFELFNTALTAAQVQMIYDAGSDGKCQPEAHVCGDGVVDTGEQCDDGNTTSGDGCSATCQLEDACATPPNGMFAWYPGDNNANDITTPPYNGTGPYFTTNGHVAEAFDCLTDPNAKIDISAILNAPGMDNTVGSVDFWVKLDNLEAEKQMILSAADSTGSELFQVVEEENGKILVSITGSSQHYWTAVTANQVLTAGTWHHVTVTHDGTTVRIYVDGVEAVIGYWNVPSGGSKTAWWDVVLASADNAYLCYRDSGTYPGRPLPLDGYLDEVEFFDHALTQSDIDSIVGAGEAGKCKPVQ